MKKYLPKQFDAIQILYDKTMEEYKDQIRDSCSIFHLDLCRYVFADITDIRRLGRSVASVKKCTLFRREWHKSLYAV